MTNPPRLPALLDGPDHLELLGCRIPHSSSPPSAIMHFFQQTVFECQVGNAFLQARASRRRSCTSPVVAAREVSPASRRLPASTNSSTRCNTGSGQCLLAAQLGEAVVAAQPIKHDADLVFRRWRRVWRRISFTTCSAGAFMGDFLKEGLGFIFVPSPLRRSSNPP
jgi:hypothetical protein